MARTYPGDQGEADEQLLCLVREPKWRHVKSRELANIVLACGVPFKVIDINKTREPFLHHDHCFGPRPGNWLLCVQEWVIDLWLATAAGSLNAAETAAKLKPIFGLDAQRVHAVYRLGGFNAVMAFYAAEQGK